MFRKSPKPFLFTLFVVLAAIVAWVPVASASEPFIGEIKIVGFNFAPRGFAFCDGQLLAIAQNQALFALLGTTYGGDGRVTFALPDLRGRVPVHSGQGPGLSNYMLGQRGGMETVSLTIANMPSHNHSATARASNARGNEQVPEDHIWAKKPRDNDYSDAAPNVSMNASAITIGNTGGSQPHENRQPFLVLNYVIALQGLFPSQN